MLREIREREYVEQDVYSLEYTDEHGDGFSFPCDENGDPDGLRPEAAANLEFCRANPERFARAGVVTKRTLRWREPAAATCECGETFPLQDVYLGACPCPNCGTWYNLFGQELLPPYKWGNIDGDE